VTSERSNPPCVLRAEGGERPKSPLAGRDGQSASDSTSEADLAGCRLLTVKAVANLLGVSVRLVWRLVAGGRFPQPIRLGARTVRWRARDIAEHIEALAAEGER